MGTKNFTSLLKERDAIYSDPNFDDADAIRVATIEADFAHLTAGKPIRRRQAA